MNNQEAIEILRIYKRDKNNNSEVFDLAIKALEDIEEWDKLRLICANEGIIVYKVKED